MSSPVQSSPAPVVRPGVLSPGTLIDNKYRIVRLLGEGGMGIVYVAEDIHTETLLVIKSIRAEFAHDPDFRERAIYEGRALARIDHPNVVRLNAVVVEEHALYLVMQFIDGESLQQLIERHVAEQRPLAVADVLRIFRMILAGLSAAHREGLIHRDIKPANILIRAKDGVAKVTDFGIAKGEEDAKAGRGHTKGIIGSLSYMAPEQLRGQRDLDKRVDIYASGIMLFEMLIGHVPFDAPSEYELMKLHTEAPLPHAHDRRPDVSTSIDDVLAMACAKRREERFASCDEFLSALDAAAVGGLRQEGSRGSTEVVGPGQTVRAPVLASSTYPLDARSPVRRMKALLVLPLVAASAGAAWLAFRSPSEPATRSPTPGAQPPAMGDAQPQKPLGTPSSLPHATPSPPPFALPQLAGSWKSDTLRDYEAVALGSVVEFRVVDPGQFPGQGYLKGEARFTLSPIAGQLTSFAVEDKIRPAPPRGYEYDARRARSTCQEVWSQVGRDALQAYYDPKAQQLSVDLVKIETSLDRFQLEGNKIIGCMSLRAVPAVQIKSTLSRVR